MCDIFALFLRSLGLVTLLTLTALSSRGEEPSPSDGADQQQIALLIKQLGDDNSAIRDTATAQLLKLGMVAKPALTAGLNSPDLEIRTRAKRLLEEDFQRRLKAFAEDTEDCRGLDLPGWKKFKQTFGGKEEARSFFVAMQREATSLLEASDKGPQQAAEAVNQWFNVLNVVLLLNGNPQTPLYPREMPTVTAATLMFVASDPEVQLKDDVAKWVAGLPLSPGFSQTVMSGESDGMFPRIVAHWLAHPAAEKNIDLAVQNLLMAMQLNLPETLTPAQQILATKNAPAWPRQLAIVAIGKYGGGEHLARLEPFLQDTAHAVIFTSPPDPSPTDIQIRDMALVFMIRLSGQDPKDYGYECLSPCECTVYDQHSIGFKDSAKRNVALKKWGEWSAALK